MKKQKIISELLLFCFAAVAILSTDSLAEPIKIGIETTLTGDAATYGQDIKNAAEFANEKLGGGHFSLVFEDDKCNGKDAVTAAKKLIEVDKVRAVVGFGCSGALLAAAPIFERAKVVAVGTESSAARISDAGDFIFRTQPSDSAGVRLLYDYLTKHHKTFGVLCAETDFAQGILGDLKKLATDGRISVYSEDILSTDKDYKPALLRLRSHAVEGLLLNAQDEAGMYQMLRQSKELGMKLPYYSFYMGASASFIALAGADAEGVVSVDVPRLDSIAGSEGAKLFEEFTAKYGPPRAWDYGFATTFEAFRAVTKALLESDDPQKYLLEAKFEGLFGPYSFDENGDIVGLSLVLKRNEHGTPVPIR